MLRNKNKMLKTCVELWITYLPMQKWLKISPSKSSAEKRPVISLSRSCALRRSSASSSDARVVRKCSRPYSSESSVPWSQEMCLCLAESAFSVLSAPVAMWINRLFSRSRWVPCFAAIDTTSMASGMLGGTVVDRSILLITARKGRAVSLSLSAGLSNSSVR